MKIECKIGEFDFRLFRALLSTSASFFFSCWPNENKARERVEPSGDKSRRIREKELRQRNGTARVREIDWPLSDNTVVFCLFHLIASCLCTFSHSVVATTTIYQSITPCTLLDATIETFHLISSFVARRPPPAARELNLSHLKRVIKFTSFACRSGEIGAQEPLSRSPLQTILSRTKHIAQCMVPMKNVHWKRKEIKPKIEEIVRFFAIRVSQTRRCSNR